MVFKEQTVNSPVAYVVDMKSSKVFNRLFPMEDKEMKQRNFHLNLTDKPQVKAKPNARSIFKNYKSCPVSPVSEECKWIDKAQQNVVDGTKNDTNSLDPKKRNSLSFFIGMDSITIKNNGKSIVDTIKSDTEKIIAEITKKYGDLDEFEPNNDLDIEPTKEEKDDGNFSSDSLEDCSLSQDASCKNKLYSKKICKKHNKTVPRRSVSNYEIGTTDKPMVPVKPAYISNKSSTLPRNMPSNLDDILDEDSINYDYSNMYRCQSVLTKRCVTRSNESVLSENSNCSSVSNEIFLRYGNEVAFQQAKFDSRYNLNDSQNGSFENLNEPDENYLDKHRHSSASFFLNQKKYMKNSCSQESILSDDMYLDNENQLCRTNCNSLESVLSDDSECTKSAPLEMLFEGTRPKRQKNTANLPRDSKSCYEFDNTSKSYGSSPNNIPHFSYLYNNYLDGSTFKHKETEIPKAPINKVYGFEVPTKELSGHKTVTRSQSLYDPQQPPPAKNIAYYFDGNNLQAYTKDNTQYKKEKKDEIPRLSSKDYMANTSKSLLPKCAEKHKYNSQMEGCDQNAMVKSRSCSFDVVLEPASKPNPLKNLMEKRNSHVQKNLEKFEEQIRKNTQTKVSKNHMNKEKAGGTKYNNATKSLERGQKNNNNKITMEFVPHKPPKPIKRTSSVKMNNRLKAGMEKAGLTSISSQYKAKLDGLQNKNYLGNKSQADNNSNIDTTDTTEKSFDIFVKEKDFNENKSEIQMDSLEVYAMQKMERMRHVSMDSLDVIDGNDFAKDSLDYYAEQENKYHFGKTAKDKINIKLSKIDSDINNPSHSRQNDSKENIAPVNSYDIKQYKNIERKIVIINKLVEMEERKMLQEKFLKEWRMRPLKANIDDGQGVVKVLSRKFEKLASKQTPSPNFVSLTLEGNKAEVQTIADNKEMKRNLSLPDILDSEQIGGLVTVGEEATNESGNEILNNTVITENAPKSLKQRVYNEMVIPKTDVHLDSENYESSTTSSSCTNSPKRLSLYGIRPKTPFRKVVKVPTPRLCMENKSVKIRPCLNTGGVIRGALVKKVAMVPVLPSKFTLNQAAPKPTPIQTMNKNSGFVRPAPRYNKSNMTRSSSVGVLNPSDSESDGQPCRQNRKQGLMRPTISSMNKMANNTNRRRGPGRAYSAVCLATGHEDSSSDAENGNGRSKAASSDTTRTGYSGSDREISAEAHEMTAKLTSNTSPSRKDDAKPDSNLSSSQLWSALTEELTKTASKVVQLYASLQREPNASAEISGLEAAILETQKVLKNAVATNQNGNEMSSLSSTDGEYRPLSGETAREKLESLVSEEANANNPAVSLIDQYSDILLNMMQNKMVNQLPSSPQSLPPNTKETSGGS